MICWNDSFVLRCAGISQSYISQWLLQQGLEMSDSKRRAFYRWYLLERNNPGEETENHMGVLSLPAADQLANLRVMGVN